MKKSEMIKWLEETDEKKLAELFREARAATIKYTGDKVYFRGLIEASNVCVKDCYYCGIRKSNINLTRFSMTEEEILYCARLANEMNYASIVLQSGERQDKEYIQFVEDILLKIKKIGNLGITLSLGEQTFETYQRWFAAGAHRYLLRIETSSPDLYKKLHPSDHLFKTRLDCLRTLKQIGYQVGTGVMMGLPNQTLEDLADDILFFEKEDIAMIGMGPYIPHQDTPLAKPDYNAKEHFRLGLVMIALTRLHLKDVNIAAATALQTLDASGREKGILAGANVIMPNITPTQYRKSYRLYDNKPCLDENAKQCMACLDKRILWTGAKIGYGEWGDSKHLRISRVI